MKIRLAVEKDISQILELRKGKDLEGLTRNIQEAKEDKGAYLIAEEKREIIGQAFLKFYGKKTAPDYPDIEGAFVREEFRSQGIATSIMAEVERIAKDKGFKKIGLAVNPILNQKAKALYERLGYKEVGNPSYIDGVYDGTEDWVIDMVKELD